VVPTDAERAGNFSSLLQPLYVPAAGLTSGCNAALLQAGVAQSAITADTAQFPRNIIPAGCISSAAQNLMNYYPEPNVSSTGTLDNYQENVNATSGSSQVSARYNRSFGNAPVRGQRGAGGGGRGQGGNRNANAPKVLRQSIAENFAYSHTASANDSFSPQLGGKSVSNGYSLSSAYTVGYGRINSTATLSWSRALALTSNYFTNGTSNPATLAGVEVGNPTIYTDPFYYGVPSISLGAGIQGLSDVTPASTVNQTIGFSDFVSWSHKRHNMRYGLDFHRIHQDTTGGSNVLGTYTFSGFATESLAQRPEAGLRIFFSGFPSSPRFRRGWTRSICAGTPGTGMCRTTGGRGRT
jgi:hypothetical protein